ncbi:MAG: SpoIIE family protein phosphatase [Spirochaetaceae bacterium]|nr:SpoIIE family protein phosphatase [Spirochaetaceae bacterium]
MAEDTALIGRADAPAKSYPNTLQRLAKHFWYAYENSGILPLADELELRQEITVLCVVDQARKPVGIIRREDLFLRLGKRFGRDVMSKDTVGGSAETAWVYPGESNILHIFEQLRGRTAETRQVPEPPSERNECIVLADSQGIFSGILSLRDVDAYMVELTNEDIALASLLQERFLANADEITRLEVSVDAWWSSAKGVGGDFYSIRRISADKFFAALCDVSGKGVAASLVVSIVWGFLKAHAMHGGLQALLASLNAAVLSCFHREKYLTGFFLVYDAKRKLLRVADMGHSHALFLRDGRSLSLKKTRVNLPLGIDEDMEPSVYAFSVMPGDTLLIYSDGIPEQDNPAGEEFGEQRLFSLLAETVAQGKVFSETLPRALEEFRRHTPQHDDMTFLMFRF